MHHRSSTVDYRTLPPQLCSALRGEVFELRRRAGSRAVPPAVSLRRLSAAGVPLSTGAAIVPLGVAPVAGGTPSVPGSEGRMASTMPTIGVAGGHAGADGGRAGRARDAGSGLGGGGRSGTAGRSSTGDRNSTGGRSDGPDDSTAGAFRIGVGRAGLDHALRVDLLVATLGAMRTRGHLDSPTPLGIMIKRSGALESTEDDLGWLRAWPIACDIGGCARGPVWAVTRHGWIDVGENSVVVLPRHWLRRPPPGHTGSS